MWRTDQNKFIIVCRNLIEMRKINNMHINNCTLSMLIYVLAYLDKIPNYVRDEMQGLLLEMASVNNRSLKKVGENGKDPWKISGENSERMKKFVELNFFHSQKILNAIYSNSSMALVKELLVSENFALYNRQYMMWYYGDLTIYGENRINNLVPGEDEVNKGMDYYNCFYTLYHKLYAYFENQCKNSYPLLEYDLFTILDLAYSRQVNKKETSELFYSQDEKKMEIYAYIKDILDKYINHYCKANVIDREEDRYKEMHTMNDISSTNGSFKKIIAHIETLNVESDVEYVRYFFVGVKKLFPKS